MDEKVKKLYKYRTFNNYTDNIIIHSSLWYANPLSFNDPFDMGLSFKQKYSQSEIRAYIRKFVNHGIRSRILPVNSRKKSMQELCEQYSSSETFFELHNKNLKELISRIGVVSLSKRSNSILMWSHYANDHKGLVFEFDYSSRTEFKNNEFPHEVKYIDQYNLLSFAEKPNVRAQQMIKILTYKSKDWEYEGEFRLIDLDTQGNQIFDKRLLTKIIFGLRASKKDMLNMIKLCKKNGFEHVLFEKAEKIEGSFELQMKPVIIEELTNNHRWLLDKIKNFKSFAESLLRSASKLIMLFKR